MKTKRYLTLQGTATLCAVAAALLTTACVEKTICNTPHPDRGAVTISLDPAAAAESYTAEIYGQKADFSASPFTFPALLAPSSYLMLVYNQPEGFTFENNTVRVEAETPDASMIIAMPGKLRTQRQIIEVMADDTLRLTTLPAIRTRDLHIELSVSEGRPELIQSVNGKLTGIAGAFNMETEKISGSAVGTSLTFTRQDDKLKADARLLGTMGDKQTLLLDFVFVDGGRTQQTEIDLTQPLAGFNDDKTTDLRVTGSVETPVGMEEVTVEITDWTTVEGEDLEAE